MSFLLDTNAVSEWVKLRPDPGLIHWMEETDEDRIFLSAITIAELSYGIERLPASKRRNRLDLWLRAELIPRFESRILPIDLQVAEAWGAVVSRSEAAGRPMSSMDGFLAATAQVHRLTLVTRNVSDFAVLDAVISPWSK